MDPDWNEIVKTAMFTRIDRAIIRDSDGNCCRVSYRDGADIAAVEAAVCAARVNPNALEEAAVRAIVDALEAYEVPVLPQGSTLKTT